MAGSAAKARALHDLIAGTRVEHSSLPEPAPPPPVETPSGPVPADVV